MPGLTSRGPSWLLGGGFCAGPRARGFTFDPGARGFTFMGSPSQPLSPDVSATTRPSDKHKMHREIEAPVVYLEELYLVYGSV